MTIIFIRKEMEQEQKQYIKDRLKNDEYVVEIEEVKRKIGGVK